VGPWHHTAIDQRRQGALSFPGAAGEAARVTRDFLTLCFQGRPEAIPGREEPVRYWSVGEEGWIDCPAWPPEGTEDRTFHLQPDGGLAESPPRGVGRHTFRADPDEPVPTFGGANLPIGLRAGPQDQAKRVESRDDVLVYTTDPLPAPLRLAGRARVTLTAVTDCVDADLAVRLTEVTPDGRSLLVGDAVGRARCRASRAEPVLVTPAVPFEATAILPPMAQTFAAGNRIRISVAGSNWPRYERNPHTGEDHFDPDEAVPAVTSLLLGGDSRSFVTLPALR
jgi:putative CocE/NonD family hydrolase